MLDDKFSSLYKLLAHENILVAELCNKSSGNYCWNLGFTWGFIDWEVEDVNRLYAKLRIRKLRENGEDAIICKPAENGSFFIKILPWTKGASFFVWRLGGDNLQSKGIALANWCYLCQ